jgi:glycosyltransferase involved in cell wall biosynthesis
MRLLFLDRMEIDYHARTPYERALGGSQSALCYLAAALAKRGHDVAMATRTTAPGRHEGVRCVSRNPGFTPEFVSKFDSVIVLNGAYGKRLREAVPNARLVLWTQHAHDQPGVSSLIHVDEVDAWDGLVTLSEWQTRKYVDVFQIGRRRFQIMRNAISPVFASGPAPTRDAAPVFAYTSTPFRGLSYLLDAWPMIHAGLPGAILNVFSSMQVYGAEAAANDAHADLYHRCRTTPGVNYVGSIPQPELAQALAASDALLYPSIFGETSCIAVLEALAAGCQVYTTRTAALPETGAPYAKMIELEPRTTLAARFAELVLADLGEGRRNPAAELDSAQRQAEEVRARSTWARRAIEWERYLHEVVAAPPR